MTDIISLKRLAQQIRRNIIESGFRAGKAGSHFGGALSAADILAVLYGSILKIDPSNPLSDDRDRFILSKGHCASALYATLCAQGFFSKEELLTYNANGTFFPTHCIRQQNRGIEISSGSLGLGLSFGVGLALSFRQRAKANRAFVLLGDGECNEGSVWEAAMSASHFKLSNLISIIDINGMQLDGATKTIMDSTDLGDKFKAFGWEIRNTNGHDLRELYAVLSTPPSGARPLAILAHTLKGKGISFMEGDHHWHHGSLQESQYALALSELEISC